jgi:hypothetical protein
MVECLNALGPGEQSIYCSRLVSLLPVSPRLNWLSQLTENASFFWWWKLELTCQRGMGTAGIWNIPQRQRQGSGQIDSWLVLKVIRFPGTQAIGLAGKIGASSSHRAEGDIPIPVLFSARALWLRALTASFCVSVTNFIFLPSPFPLGPLAIYQLPPHGW